MIHKYGQTAANQQHHEKKVEEMTVAQPHGKSVWPYEVIRIDLWNGRNARHSGNGDLDPSGNDYGEDRDSDSYQDSGTNPNTKPPVLWVVHRCVRSIKRNHNLNFIGLIASSQKRALSSTSSRFLR